LLARDAKVPRRLLARCQPDSIREFRASAHQRYNDGLSAAAANRRLAAIYLWGYSAEMLLKAAYFTLLGHDEATPITWAGHLQPAIARGRTLGIAWPGGGAGHNVRAWAELLILERAAMAGMAYAPDFGLEVQVNGQRLGQLWNETLRYHKNVAYLYEVTQVRLATEWFLTNFEAL
jgi:hypothetical protein